jgi:hypothetical protein
MSKFAVGLACSQFPALASQAASRSATKIAVK